MSALDFAQTLQLLWLALAVVLLALVALMLEFVVRRPLGQMLMLAGGLLLALAGAIGWLLAWPMALGAVVLAMPCLAAWGARSEAVRRICAPLVTSATAWAGLLVLSLLAARSLVGGLTRPDELPLDAIGSLIEKLEVPGVAALTDAGRALPVFRYGDGPMAEKAELATLADQRFAHKIVKLSGPSNASNCHGLFFTGGKYAIQGTDVPAILEDNGYAAVAEAQPGDLVIYRCSSGEVTHTGQVKLIDRERQLVLVESKWGPLGTYLHPCHAQPFGEQFAYYRSPRPGHQLALQSTVPDATTPSADPGAAPSDEQSLAVERRAIPLWQKALGKWRRPRA